MPLYLTGHGILSLNVRSLLAGVGCENHFGEKIIEVSKTIDNPEATAFVLFMKFTS